MQDLSGMFTKMAQYVNEAQQYIERIDQYTSDSLSNMEKGFNEVKTTEQRESSNRLLCFKVFFIIIFFLVLYIVFIA